MRILVADTFPQESREGLIRRGHECHYEPATTSDQLPSALTGFDAVIVRSTKVTAEAFEAADSLRLVIRAGSGTNTIDCHAANLHGVYVCNVPGRNAAAVAELTLGLLLAIDRRIPDNVADLRQGRWNKSDYSRARGILGRKVGILGLGQIGLAFAERVAAFGAEVYAVAKEGRDERTLERTRRIGITFVDSPETLAATCDVLSVHVPANAGTRGLVGRSLLDALQPGAIVLNTARGDVLDEDALLDAMDTKDVRAGLDVFSGEPATGAGTFDSTLTRHPNVYGTHHIGASTEQAQQAVADGVVEIVDAFDAGTVLNCVSHPSGEVTELHPGGVS
ncbi:D-3-phosphoglycerate dehydrogenase [Lipingzhangella halophila]|uniref:D-3-phosphoglycerate dehydrogenase n=1 Tax=Lipingzhangella halophila TaxID=1783352 RepID=A0A7W7W1C8_9ACTN|nr:NAD(P)-dependent oxidoreductase [Lipingzhangella halophila]MBB4929624.1 D-3-phosphoglycerate dehydrogenase [Lipingzhangella halophila]